MSERFSATHCHLDAASLTFLVTTVPSSAPEYSLADGNWSKEVLFGLLGLILIVVVPCIGVLLKLCLSRYGIPNYKQAPLEGMQIFTQYSCICELTKCQAIKVS